MPSVIGAAVGAVALGLALGRRGKLLWAIVGAAVGAFVGYLVLGAIGVP